MLPRLTTWDGSNSSATTIRGPSRSFGGGFAAILQMRVDPQNHVLDVVQSLFEIFILNSRKDVLVKLQELLQSGLSSDLLLDNPIADIVGKGQIAEDGGLSRKNRGGVPASLTGDCGFQGR